MSCNITYEHASTSIIMMMIFIIVLLITVRKRGPEESLNGHSPKIARLECKMLLTLGAHAHEGYSILNCLFVFFCLFVCLLPVSWFLFTFI